MNSRFYRFVHTKISKMKKSDILEKFGEKLKEYRKLKGLSQEQLAEKANMHRTYIGMLERAEKNITLLNIEKIAIALEIKITDLINQK